MFISPFDEKNSHSSGVNSLAFSVILFTFASRKCFVMCLSPILRPNTSLRVRSLYSYSGKNREIHRVLQGNRLQDRIANVADAFGKDSENSYIYVPCGHCPECIAARQNNIVQRVETESDSHHLFFCTLTYDNKHLPKIQVQVPEERFTSSEQSDLVECSCTLFEASDPNEERSDFATTYESPSNEDIESWLSCGVDDLSSPDSLNALLEEIPSRDDDSSFIGSPRPGYRSIEIPFADIHDIQLLLKNLRDNLPKDPVFGDRDLKYVAVSELGKANGRPHFHILFLVEKKPCDIGEFGRITQLYTLEKCLWQHVFKYWSHNVGTRKNPVYEKLFSYRKRFFGSRVYTNFDLHWVDPSRTKDGTRNVAFYVTKYMLKGSERERRRQQFLSLNLEESEYKEVWNVIKCRCTISKGLGVNGRCVVRTYPSYSRVALADYAAALASIHDLPEENEDIPEEFFPKVIGSVKRRIMVPDKKVLQKLHGNVLVDLGKSPGPIYIDSQGKHRPLGRYFQKFEEIYSIQDFYDLYYNYDDRNDVPSYRQDPKVLGRKVLAHTNRCAQVERNSSFDTSPALLWGSDFEDNNSFHLVF